MLADRSPRRKPVNEAGDHRPTAGDFPAAALIALIRVYQRLVSPVLPVVFGAACGCRFAPSCSHYAIQAVDRHGILSGGWLAMRRLLKCTPLHPGGLDPVPSHLFRSPRCARVAR